MGKYKGGTHADFSDAIDPPNPIVLTSCKFSHLSVRGVLVLNTKINKSLCSACILVGVYHEDIAIAVISKPCPWKTLWHHFQLLGCAVVSNSWTTTTAFVATLWCCNPCWGCTAWCCPTCCGSCGCCTTQSGSGWSCPTSCCTGWRNRKEGGNDCNHNDCENWILHKKWK